MHLDLRSRLLDHAQIVERELGRRRSGMPNPPSTAGLTNGLHVITMVAMVSGRKALVAQSGDIFGRGIAEESAVFPAELRWAQVADTVARATCVDSLKEHQPAGFVQP